MHTSHLRTLYTNVLTVSRNSQNPSTYHHSLTWWEVVHCIAGCQYGSEWLQVPMSCQLLSPSQHLELSHLEQHRKWIPIWIGMYRILHAIHNPIYFLMSVQMAHERPHHIDASRDARARPDVAV